MEIDLEIYSHLAKCGVLEGGLNNPSHKIFLDSRKVLMDKDTSILFENGIAVARYLIYIKRKLEAHLQVDEQQSRIHYKIEEDKLQQLRQAVTPSIRLHNWNILIKEIMKVGIKVNADMKSLLVAGDYGIINDYLKQLYSFEMVQSGENDTKNTDETTFQSIYQGEGAIDIGEMTVQTRPSETVTCLEFLLNVICKSFSMNPKQAAGLLTNANKYLNIAIIKGLKGQFEPVISLYQEVYAHSKHMTSLIENENTYNLSTSTLTLMLNAFKPGFLSQDEEVVSWCCRLFAKIAYDFIDAGEIIGNAWDWFIDESNTSGGQGVIETCLQAMKKNQYLTDNMVPVLVNFARYNFAELFTHHIRKYLSIPADYFNFMHEILIPLKESKFSREELINSGVIDFLIEHCILKGDTTTGSIDTTKNDRQVALCLLTTLWCMYQDKFEKIIENYDDNNKSRIFQHLKNTSSSEPQSLGTIALTILKRNCRDKSQSLRVSLQQFHNYLDYQINFHLREINMLLFYIKHQYFL